MSSHPRFRFPAFAFLAVAASLIALPAAAWSLARNWIERGVAFAFDVLSRQPSFDFGVGRLATAAGVPLGYDAPPVHAMRHEAGTSRRSAARNI